MTVEFFVFYQVKSYHIPAEQIELELNGIESNLAQLEKEGVELEKQLRGCEEGTLPLPLTRTPFFFPRFGRKNKIEQTARSSGRRRCVLPSCNE